MPLFFVLTFAVSWTCFFGAAALAPAGTSPTAGAAGAVYLAGVFGPALVASGLTALAGGRRAVSALLKRIVAAPSSALLFTFALAYMPAAKLMAALVHRVLFRGWPTFGVQDAYLGLIVIPFSTPAQAGEEVGWRGYALPRLARRFGLGPASVILGIIWGLWHLPFFYMVGADKTGQSIPMYVAGTTAMSVAMAWLYWRSNGSLLITMFMHAAVNNLSGIVPTQLAGATDVWSLAAAPIAWLSVGVMWGIAAWCLLKMRGASLRPDIAKSSIVNS